MSDSTNPAINRELWRMPRVTQETGLPRASVYHLVNLGQFPKPIKLTARASAWIASEVEAWKDERIAASREGAA